MPESKLYEVIKQIVEDHVKALAPADQRPIEITVTSVQQGFGFGSGKGIGPVYFKFQDLPITNGCTIVGIPLSDNGGTWYYAVGVR